MKAMVAGLLVMVAGSVLGQLPDTPVDFIISKVSSTSVFEGKMIGGPDVVIRIVPRPPISSKKLERMRETMVGKQGQIFLPLNEVIALRRAKERKVFEVRDFTINGVSVVGAFR